MDKVAPTAADAVAGIPTAPASPSGCFGLAGIR